LAGVLPSNKRAVVAWLREHGLAATDLTNTNQTGTGRIVATYPYEDEHGHLLFEVVRFDPKDFRQRRPDGAWNVEGVRRVLYRLPDLLRAEFVYIVEGEKDADNLRAIGLTATCNPGGAGKWRPEFADFFKSHQYVAIIADADEAGRKHADQIAAALAGKVASLKILELANLPLKGDVSDWLSAGRTREQLEALAASAPEWHAVASREESPWAAAVAAPDFLLSAEEEVDWLEYPFLAPGSLTEFFSPRGVGKTQVAMYLGIKQAQAGKRVLVLDRDNSRREVKRRLEAWGAADARTLKILTRDKVPPLTDTAKWATFPFSDYDLLIVDSLDASTEGAGESDSAKPSRAIAPLLDIAHRASGPAILILGNTVRSGQHSRCSGVVEDRADICFEVRDATGLIPTGQKEWWEELPPASAGDWAARASRRKRREKYRLACVASKFRIGEEPEPIMLEVDLSGAWTVRDVTQEVCNNANAARIEAAESIEKQETNIVQMFISKIRGSELTKGEGEEYLQSLGVSRDKARAIIDRQTAWTVEKKRDKPGKPCVLKPVSCETAAKISVAVNPQQTDVSEDGISADTAGIGRREYPNVKPSPSAASSVVGISAEEPGYENLDL
jgi:5S rRNA maturation endonuclease (ribonuclease M5)